MISRLELRAITDRPHHPELQVLVDGEERLRGVRRKDARNDVADVIDSEAFLPRSEPHRVALYGCSCGEFGCAVLTTLVVGESDSIRWTGFLAGAGGPYERSLPESPLPDPFQDQVPQDRLDLPDLVFDREQYVGAIRELAAGRRWETRTRAVIRHAGHLLPRVDRVGPPVKPEWRLSAPWDGADPVIWVRVREGRQLPTWEMPLPDGPADEAAADLVAKLSANHPRDIPEAHLVER